MKRPKRLSATQLSKLSAKEYLAYIEAIDKYEEYRKTIPPSPLQTLTRKRNWNIGRCAMLKWHIRDLGLNHSAVISICAMLDYHAMMLRRHNKEQKAIK